MPRMWTGGVLILLLLQVLTAETQEPPPNFSVLLPAQLWHPSSSKVCVHVSFLNNPAEFRVELQTSSQKWQLFQVSVLPQGLFHCFTFQVPPPAGGSEEVATVTAGVLQSSTQFKATKTVLIKRKRIKRYFLIDKAIYEPGETVNLWIMHLDENFHSSPQKVPLVQLQDPDGNHVGQWLNVMPQHGIVDLSFPLSTKAALGTYTISAGDDRHTFTVEPAELHKFLVELQLPPVVSLSDKSFQFNVCARYPYGKPVHGLVKTSVCHQFYRGTWYTDGPGEDSCQNIAGQMDTTGCFVAAADMETLKADVNSYLLSLEVQAMVTETDTGIVVQRSGSSRLSYALSHVTFEGASSYYQSGFPYRGKMKLTGANETPLKRQTLHLTVRQGSQLLLNETYETDDMGTTSFLLDTKSWGQENMELEGWYKMEEPDVEERKYALYHVAALHTVTAMYTSSRSVLQIQVLQGELTCGRDQQLRVDYILEPSEVEDGYMDIAYFVMAKGGIVDEGQKKVKKDAPHGSFKITLNITSHMAPQAHVLVYATFPNQRAMADSTLLQISQCLPNEVTLGFSVPEVLPGSKVDMKMQAAPGSFCAVRTTDHKIQLGSQEAELTANSLYNLFGDWYQGGHPSEDQEPHPCMEPGPQGRQPTIWIPPWFQMDPDINSLFKDAGLKIITNAAIIKPVDCSIPLVMSLQTGSSGQGSSQDSHAQEQMLFHNTWLWSLHSIGSSGTESIPVTVPDTITEWEASMLCTADVGFSLSPPALLKVFKSFFVELKIPYSVFIGESFSLQVTVSNMLPNCMKVQVSLGDSLDFWVSPCPSCSYSRCLCADDSETFSWNITARTLGEVNLTVSTEALSKQHICAGQETVVPDQGRTDTLIRSLLVQPEGVSVEKTHSSWFCLEGSYVESVPLQVPDDVVEGSANAYISVLGDVMGPALNNLDKLIQMPYGCGEQNIVVFTPITSVLRYLEHTHQLTEEIQTRAYGYLISGYQQQLTYKHSDGSYSAFGKRDGAGNIWLTASVLKSFGQAGSYVPIDQQNIKDAVRWVKEHQLPSGCFTATKGSVNGDETLTVHVVLSLLELGMHPSDDTVANALSCVKASAANLSSLYTQALLAYACSLTGDVGTRALLLELIDQQAIRSDGQIHWTYSTRTAERGGYWNQPFSVDVELTSYILLAILSDPDLESVDIGRASAIVQWVTRQQNDRGGFSSSQDTVVALQALARYAALTYSEDGEVAVTMTSTHGFQKTFHVDNQNRLLLQRATLPEVPGSYEVQLNGNRCVLVQVTLRYNVPPPMSDMTFALSVDTEPQDCAEYTGLLHLNIHVRYNGKSKESNVAIIEVGMLSGYSPTEDTERVLLQRPLVKKVEMTGTTVSIYVQNLDSAPQSYPVLMQRKSLVGNRQPALVKVCDCCQPEDNAVAEYSAPCSAVEESNKTS